MEKNRLNEAFMKLYDKLYFWLNKGIEMIPNFIIAILVLVFFNIISKLLARYGEKMLNAVSQNEVVNKLIIRFIVILTIGIGSFFALGIMHLDRTVTSLLTGIGIIGLALSFAFQHTAANLLSGIIIAIRSTINVGDLIKSNGEFGNVLKVGLRSTRIMNVRGQHVEIPNRLLMDNTFSEYSQSGFRRIDVTGQMNFREDLDHIKRLLEDEMAKFDFVYQEKYPNMVYNKLVNEKVEYTLRVWMNFKANDGEYVNARSQCIVRMSEIFRQNNIEIPTTEIVYHKK